MRTHLIPTARMLTHGGSGGDAYLRSPRSRNTEWKCNFPKGETMHTKEAIQFALTVSNGTVLSAIDKMSDAATTFPTPNGGCHPLWVLGHLTMVEGIIPEVLFGQKNPVAGWEKTFRSGPQTP